MYILLLSSIAYYPVAFTLACENSRVSWLFAAGDVSRGGTCATQRQEFHTDDVNQCLQNTSGSHGVPHPNLLNVYVSPSRFYQSVAFICERAPAKLKCFFQRRISTKFDCNVRDSSRWHLTFVAFFLLPVIRKQSLKQCKYSVDQSALLTGFRTDFTSSAWNFCR